ncbi:protein MULTIPOLAR SPINDLE 1 [Dioscorea cayenensis subsp. rotundata]|uniref:Protein MULTIPOLAR SPINDLE 1 n=1 Tax=Dioscorea cayennensis subsp. rotundata TaxID=55577 RepID=A0AB40AKS4_DIOCR|nr:protein MULTIPOLAR SPINDLE 1 [Dioscorea cayenensis subsp. rotundata]
MDFNPSSSSTSDPSSLKLAIAIALLRSKNLNFSSSHSDAQRWRQKAKERKREIQRLREEFKQLEDGIRAEVVPQIAACRCHFFDDCGKLSPRSGQIGREGLWIDEVLRRRFLRLMRWKERRRKLDDSVRKRHFIELNSEDEIGKLNTSIDFLVELSNGKFVENDFSFRALSHQAVDFILASLRNLLSLEKESEVIEEMITGLILNMTQRMCTATNEESLASATDADFCVQHLIRKLGDEPFIGQRVVLAVSQKICIQVDSLLLTDPFDDAYLGANDSMFLMIQLIEFLISDYLSIWTANEDFDWRLLEEWTRSVLQARNALVLLESRNGLYVLFIERVIREIGKQLGPLQQQGKLNLDILSNLHF